MAKLDAEEGPPLGEPGARSGGQKIPVVGGNFLAGRGASWGSKKVPKRVQKGGPGDLKKGAKRGPKRGVRGGVQKGSKKGPKRGPKRGVQKGGSGGSRDDRPPKNPKIATA